MNSPAVDIASMLAQDSDLGLAIGTNLFIGMEPGLPNTCVTIFDTHGRPNQLTLNEPGLEYPSIQIRVRSTSYQTGWALIEGIKALLHGRANETCDSTLYSLIYCISGPALLDWDDNSRVRFIVNFNINRRT